MVWDSSYHDKYKKRVNVLESNIKSENLLQNFLSIIFLDIDGVLNKGLVYSNSPIEDVIIAKQYGWMNRSLIANFNKLIEVTNARIVISSSWRYDNLKENKKMLSAFNVHGEVIGQTPNLGHEYCRGEEVRAWLELNEKLLGGPNDQFTDYIILDDCDDFLPDQLSFFVKTDPYVGFSSEANIVATKLLLTKSVTTPVKY